MVKPISVSLTFILFSKVSTLLILGALYFSIPFSFAGEYGKCSVNAIYLELEIKVYPAIPVVFWYALDIPPSIIYKSPSPLIGLSPYLFLQEHVHFCLLYTSPS